MLGTMALEGILCSLSPNPRIRPETNSIPPEEHQVGCWGHTGVLVANAPHSAHRVRGPCGRSEGFVDDHPQFPHAGVDGAPPGSSCCQSGQGQQYGGGAAMAK